MVCYMLTVKCLRQKMIRFIICCPRLLDENQKKDKKQLFFGKEIRVIYTNTQF